MKRSVGFIVLFLITFLSFSQENTVNDDVKVGLVLSGGGAKGVAHIGALKVIEESGVRIDYIAGTSMGAIVGALYASGYSADELMAIFSEVDFEELIADDFLRKNKSFLEKEDADKRAIALPFNKFKLSFPSALSKGQNVYNYYVKLLNHVKDVDDFSKLPIPFFCVGTDAESGKQYILDKGYLPDAIAASGAIPSLFEPVMIDDKLLIDGGIANNYPIEELLAKNVDQVIGVDVQDSLRTREQLKTISDVMLQVSNFNTHRQMDEKIEKTSIYIKPDISEFTIVSFDEGEAILASGLEAAKTKKEALIALAKRQQKQKREKVAKTLGEKHTIKNITIEGNDRYTRAYILGKLKLKTPSKVSYEKIDRGIKALAATQNFHAIRYKLKNDTILDLKIRETNNKTLLKLGVHYDNLYKSAALVNITQKQLLTNNDVASLDVILGDNIRYDFDYYIDKGFYWSVGFKSRINTFERDVNLSIFENGVLSGSDTSIELEAFDFTNQLYVETLIKKEFSLGLGAEHKQLKLDYNDVNTKVRLEDNNYLSTFGTLRYDSRDDKYFPTRGAYFDGDFHLYFYSEDKEPDFEQFSIAKAKMGFAVTLLKNVYLNVFTEGGIRVGNNTTPSFDFVLGGYGNNFINNYKPFYGYDFMSIAGDSYVKADIDLHYQFYKKHFLTLSANIANVDDGLFKDSDWLSLPEYSGYAAGYGLKTFLGPMQVKCSWSPEVKKAHWFISLGYWF